MLPLDRFQVCKFLRIPENQFDYWDRFYDPREFSSTPKHPYRFNDLIIYSILRTIIIKDRTRPADLEPCDPDKPLWELRERLMQRQANELLFCLWRRKKRSFLLTLGEFEADYWKYKHQGLFTYSVKEFRLELLERIQLP